MKLSRIIVIASVAVLSAAATSASAESSPQFIENMKVRCTTKAAQKSDLCVAWFTSAYDSGETKEIDRDVADTIGLCFREAKDHDDVGPSSMSGRSAAQLIREKEAGKPGRDNKWVDECIRVTTAQLGAAWKKDVMRAAFDDRVKRLVDRDFESKCGTRTDFQRGGMPFKLVMWNKVKAKTVFFEGKDPDGTSVSVLCNGTVVAKPANGKPVTALPRTIGEVKAEEKKGCLSYCQNHDEICIEGVRRGKVTAPCKAYCSSKCQ